MRAVRWVQWPFSKFHVDAGRNPLTLTQSSGQRKSWNHHHQGANENSFHGVEGTQTVLYRQQKPALKQKVVFHGGKIRNPVDDFGFLMY
jgi:hypothetical protein